MKLSHSEQGLVDRVGHGKGWKRLAMSGQLPAAQKKNTGWAQGLDRRQVVNKVVHSRHTDQRQAIRVLRCLSRRRLSVAQQGRVSRRRGRKSMAMALGRGRAERQNEPGG